MPVIMWRGPFYYLVKISQHLAKFLWSTVYDKILFYGIIIIRYNLLFILTTIVIKFYGAPFSKQQLEKT